MVNILCGYISCEIYLIITKEKIIKKKDLLIWGFYVTFNTVQVISRRVAGRAEETSTYSSSGFCTVNCQPTASNYQLSHKKKEDTEFYELIIFQ